METKHIFTEEEFEIIKEAIKDSLNSYGMPFIETNDEHGRSVSMSFETFFKDLKRNLNVE